MNLISQLWPFGSCYPSQGFRVTLVHWLGVRKFTEYRSSNLSDVGDVGTPGTQAKAKKEARGGGLLRPRVSFARHRTSDLFLAHTRTMRPCTFSVSAFLALPSRSKCPPSLSTQTFYSLSRAASPCSSCSDDGSAPRSFPVFLIFQSLRFGATFQRLRVTLRRMGLLWRTKGSSKGPLRS